MNRNTVFQLGVILLVLTLFPVSCADDASFQPDLSRFTIFRVRLTDNPAEVEAVNIDLKKVVVIGRGERQEFELDTEAGVYNLLDYQNGLSTLIASRLLEIDFVREVRLVLGENNSIVVDAEEYPLRVPSGSASGLKIKTCIDLSDDVEYDLLIDFDAEQSVVRLGNGNYLLKPVIRVLNEDGRCGEDDNDDEDDDDDGDPSIDDLPESARAFLEQEYDGYTFEVTRTTICDYDEPVFSVRARSGEEEIFLDFNAATGVFLQRLVPVGSEDLPGGAGELIDRNYRPYRLAGGTFFRVEREDQRTRFLLRLLHPGGMKYLEVLIDESSNVLCERVVR